MPNKTQINQMITQYAQDLTERGVEKSLAMRVSAILAKEALGETRTEEEQRWIELANVQIALYEQCNEEDDEFTINEHELQDAMENAVTGLASMIISHNSMVEVLNGLHEGIFPEEIGFITQSVENIRNGLLQIADSLALDLILDADGTLTLLDD